MQSEKRKKKLKCFEARIDSGDELPFNPDRMRLSTPEKGQVLESAILPCAKESGFTGRRDSQHPRTEIKEAAMRQGTS